MIKYEIKLTQNQRPVPVVIFEDEKYSLLNEFLLAERSFRREILSSVNNVDLGMTESESFSGNAFTLDIDSENCEIISDMDGRELEVPTVEFKKILLEYIYTLREIKVKEKLDKLGHNHDHHHGHDHDCLH